MKGDGIFILVYRMCLFFDWSYNIGSVFRLPAQGIYTKTFQGNESKAIRLHKDARPFEYWFSIIFEFGASFLLIGVGFWLLRDIPAVNEWYAEIRAMLPY